MKTKYLLIGGTRHGETVTDEEDTPRPYLTLLEKPNRGGRHALYTLRRFYIFSPGELALSYPFYASAEHMTDEEAFAALAEYTGMENKRAATPDEVAAYVENLIKEQSA